MASNLSLINEEFLAENISKYLYDTCMHDKSNKGYKERDVFPNVREKVVGELDFLEDVKEAKTYWENLRKRYNKKRNDVKKSDRSGTSLFEKGKARKAFQPYNLFAMA